MTVDQVRALFIKEEAPYRLCGERQFNNLLRQGEGVYWRYDGRRLWLRSAAKVAAALGVGRFAVTAVSVPLAGLVGPIKLVRAHFYAALHSARAKERPTGQPISRHILQQLTGVDPNSQRAYEKLLKLKVRRNLAVGERVVGKKGERPSAQQERVEERAWRVGRGLFVLNDRKGKQGPAGQSYLAWQLPNSYGGVHVTRPSRIRRRLNRQLHDLREKGAGNEQPMAPTRYLKTAQALRTATLAPDAYLVSGRYGRGNGRVWTAWST